MGWMDKVGGLLQQYAGSAAGSPPADVQDHFDQVSENAPPEELAKGVSAAVQSDDTPPFQQIVSKVFGGANDQQKAGILNALSSGGGAGLLSQITGGSGASVSPDQASQVSPDDVHDAAQQAASQNPDVIHMVSGYLAQNPDLLKQLGGGTLASIMGKMGGR